MTLENNECLEQPLLFINGILNADINNFNFYNNSIKNIIQEYSMIQIIKV